VPIANVAAELLIPNANHGETVISEFSTRHVRSEWQNASPPADRRFAPGR